MGAKTETQDEYGVVQGEYRVELPDGRVQIVSYHADHENGFIADVRYEGEAHPEPAYKAPVHPVAHHAVHAAPVVPHHAVHAAPLVAHPVPVVPHHAVHPAPVVPHHAVHPAPVVPHHAVHHAVHPAPYAPEPAYHPAPAYHPEPYHEEKPKDYQFGYDVHGYDEYGNPNVHSRTEQRDGYNVKGQYRVELPDCRVQIVDYFVD